MASRIEDEQQLPPADVVAAGARPNVPLCPACTDSYRHGIEPQGSACDARYDHAREELEAAGVTADETTTGVLAGRIARGETTAAAIADQLERTQP